MPRRIQHGARGPRRDPHAAAQGTMHAAQRRPLQRGATSANYSTHTPHNPPLTLPALMHPSSISVEHLFPMAPDLDYMSCFMTR